MICYTVAQVVFTEEIYTVTEGEDVYVEVCIALYDDVALNSSSANGTFDISTTNVTGLLIYTYYLFLQNTIYCLKMKG